MGWHEWYAALALGITIFLGAYGLMSLAQDIQRVPEVDLAPVAAAPVPCEDVQRYTWAADETKDLCVRLCDKAGDR